MNKKTSFVLLVLITSMILGGITNSAVAQKDYSILITLAKKAQTQIQNQINEESSEEIKELFKQGQSEVFALEESLANNNVDSAKEHFLIAMKIFTQITHMLNESSVSESSTTQLRVAPQHDYSSDLERIDKYVYSLKALAKRYNAPISFEKLDVLFDSARKQIDTNQYDQISQTIQEIKSLVIEINNEIREFAAKQEHESAKRYAQQYIEQLDRLIENAKSQGVSEEIIQKLEAAREKLSSASSPQEIVKQIKEIISIKKQFELTKNDRLESRVIQVEKTLLRLAGIDGVDQNKIQEAKELFDKIKDLLRQGQIESANELLRELNSLLIEISKST